ncbi:MAG: glycosyl hydrolase [bacterium]|nr:glycosyl hydrolase [bacterium]
MRYQNISLFRFFALVFILLVTPVMLFAQVGDSCATHASLSISSSKTSYTVGEQIQGTLAFTNHVAPASIRFEVSVKRDNTVIFTKSQDLQTNKGDNTYSLASVVDNTSIPQPGSYVLTVTARDLSSGTNCSWTASFSFTAFNPTVACKSSTGTPLSGVFGTMTNIYPDQLDRTGKILSNLDDLGIKLIRFDFFWSAIEPQPGQFDWTYYDAVVSYLHDKKINILPVLYGAPQWAGQPGCNPILQPVCTPRDHLPEYARFAARVVERYKPGGILAKQKGWTDGYGISHWQIWNEPNGRWSWYPQPNVSEYVRMLSLTNVEIRKVDPSAIIMYGGFTPEIGGRDGFDVFLEGMYQRGAKACFDTLSLHPYSGDDSPSVAFKKFTPVIKNIAARYGDTSKPLWFTEFGGWNTNNDPLREKIMADYVEEAYRVFRDYASTVTFAGFIDNAPTESNGLLRYDFTKRLAFERLRNILAPTKLLQSLVIDGKDYFLGEMLTGNGTVVNPTNQPIIASFRIELSQSRKPGAQPVLIWSRDVDNLSLKPGSTKFTLEDAFGFKPTIPNDPLYVGEWMLAIRRKDAGTSDMVSAGFTIKAPQLKLILAISPKEHELDQNIAKTKAGTITNPMSQPIVASFKIELFQSNTLKFTRHITNISLPPGTHSFTLADAIGVGFIPANPDFVGTWKLKITALTANTSAEDTFTIIMPRPVTIRIQGDSDQGQTKPLQGFLGSFDWPPPGDVFSRLVAPLKPQFWRLGACVYWSKCYEIARQLGGKVTFITSDGYAFAKDGEMYSIQPWNDFRCGVSTDGWKCYREFLKGILEKSKAAPVDYWDFWGEPDDWGRVGPTEKMFETFKVMHEVFRSTNPSQKIVAPSTGSFDGKEGFSVLSFLDYAVRNNLRLDAVSWHEFASPEDVAAHVAAVRKFFTEHPSFCRPACPEIHVNEFAVAEHHLIPGWGLGWLAAFDAARINWASRSCWYFTYQGTRLNDCGRALNGLLLHDDTTPQPLYWVHRAYAEMIGKRLAAVSSNARTPVLAAKDDQSKTVHILAGRYSCGQNLRWCTWTNTADHQNDQKAPLLDVTLLIQKYPYAVPGSQVRAEIQRIPNEGIPGPLSQPVILPPRTLTVASDGSVIIDLKGFEDGSVYSIVLKPLAAAPIVTAITPPSGPIGIEVTVTGTGFTPTGNRINFAGVSNAVIKLNSPDGKTLSFTIPATPCDQLKGDSCIAKVLDPGTYSISVTNANGTSNEVMFAVTALSGTGVDVQVNTAKTIETMPPSLFGVNTGASQLGPIWLGRLASTLRGDGLLANVFIRLIDPLPKDANYEFHSMDKDIKTMFAEGATPIVDLAGMPPPYSSKCATFLMPQYTQVRYRDQLFYCLTDSESYIPAYAAAPPKDYAAWEQYIKTIATRMKGLGVRYYEVWNEPDIPNFWRNATPEEYFRTIESMIRGIKSADPQAKIILPALASAESKVNNEFAMEMVLRRLKQTFPTNTPVDMISWHRYWTLTAADFARDKAIVETALSRYGYSPNIPMIVDEWNDGLLNNPRSDHETGAASVTNAVRTFVNLGLNHTFYTLSDNELLFPAEQEFQGAGALFTANDIIKPSYNAFRALKKLDAARISAVESNASFVTALATKSSSRTSVLLTNFENAERLAKHQTVNLTVSNLAPGTYTLTRYLIDRDHSNSCRLNKKTEPTRSTTECGIGGIIDQKVKQAKDTAIQSAAKVFKDHFQFQVQRFPNYTSQDIDYFFARASEVFAGIKTAEQASQEIRTYCTSRGLNPDHCVEDVTAAYTKALVAYSSTLQKNIDLINQMDGVKLEAVETKTITVPETGIYHATLSMEPYSVMLVQLTLTQSL